MTLQRIGQYCIVEKLGEGGMGIVYRGQHETRNLRVAIKLLNHRCAQDPAAVERFHREARITSALHHPHICAMYEFGEHDGCPYMVMELLDGQTLRDTLDGWPMPLDRM